ncbi:MAG TPA: ankyrin repeat domain-containing protein [Verrucomicrobiaceae bacterium]
MTSFTRAAGGSSDLADAAEKKDWPKVESLIQSHADAKVAQIDGMTALHWAVYHDQTMIAQKLIAAGANVTAANRYGITPLSLACVNGNDTLVKALLEGGADPNTVLRGGESVLMLAARTGKVEPAAALLKKGALVDATDHKGQTALMWAAAEGHGGMTGLLIQCGADRYRRLNSGFTAFLFAAREGRIDAARALLKAGADPNEAIVTKEKSGARDAADGTSALLLAIENGHFELAMILVEAGANPNDLRSGFAPLHTLTWVRKPNRGDDEAGQPPPETTGRLTSLEFARRLLAKGANVNATVTDRAKSKAGGIGKEGATPFLLAAKTADLPLMKLLIELGANPLQPNKDGSTPLMAAAGLGTSAPDEEAGTEEECLAAVAYLLTLGADLNTVDRNGETAMHGAAYKSLPKMVQLLADKGANIDIWNQKNKHGWTPLLIAQGFRNGNFKPSAETIEAISKVMLAAGATPPPPPDRSGLGERKKKYDKS